VRQPWQDYTVEVAEDGVLQDPMCRVGHLAAVIHDSPRVLQWLRCCQIRRRRIERTICPSAATVLTS
jgi:hypothetical protein